MGAQVAAHAAGQGLEVVLLDLPSPAPERSALARRGLETLKKLRPSPLHLPEHAALIRPGNFEDDWSSLEDADWVFEAVVEDVEVKRQLFSRVAAVVKPTAIVTSNTSGLGIAAMTSHLLPEFRRRFLGTHFFNPPRYLRLLETIPGPDTDPGAVAEISAFCDEVLGKGVVRGQGHPELHRQPRRLVRLRAGHPGHAGARPHDRGGRRPDRPRHRPGQERHLPHRRHRGGRRLREGLVEPLRRRPRRPRARGLPRPRLHADDGRARVAGREDGRRLLPEGRPADPGPRLEDAGAPRAPEGEVRLGGGGAVGGGRRGEAPADPGREGQGGPVPLTRALLDLPLRRVARARDLRRRRLGGPRHGVGLRLG